MILYHITKRKHIMSILRYGLKPAFRRGINCSDIKCDMVFLTNDVDYIAREQCGYKWIKKHDSVVLHVDVTDLYIVPQKYSDGMTYTLSNIEFVTDNISPERIVKVEEIKKSVLKVV